MILVSKTYASYQVANGAPDRTPSTGFEFSDRPLTFRGLVRELRLNFAGGVVVPVGKNPAWSEVRTTYTVHRSGSIETRTIMLGACYGRSTKYWIKAIRAAGLLA